MSYTHSWRAQDFWLLSRFDEALAAWDQAIAFDDRSDASLRQGRPATVAASGTK